MTDLVSLKFQVNTEDLKKGQAGLDGIAKSGKGASESVNQFNNETKDTASGLGGLFNSLKNNKQQVQEFGRKAGAASIQLQQLTGQVQMGTSLSTALSQQAADLGFVLGFPLLGAVTGLAAGFAGPLINSLTETEEETRNVREEVEGLAKDFESLTAAQKSYVRLEVSSEIGELETQIKRLKNEQASLLELMQTPINFNVDKLKELGLQYAQVSSDIDTKSKKLEDLKGNVDDNVNSIEDLIAEIQKETSELGLSSGQLAINTAERAKANKEQMERLRLAIKESEARKKELKEQSEAKRKAEQLRREYENQVKSSNRLIDSLKTKIETYGKTQSAMIRYTGQMAAAEAATEGQRTKIELLTEEYARMVEETEAAKAAQKEFDESSREAAKQAEESAREYERTFNTLSDNITDAIMDFRSLGDVGQAVAEQIKRAFVRNAIVNPLLGSFGMPAVGATPTGTSSIDSASAAGSIFDIFNGGSSALTGVGGFLSTALPVVGLLAAFGGAFKKPSDKLQTSSIDVASGLTFAGGFQGEKFSQENRDFADALAAQVSLLSGIFDGLTGQSPGGGIDLLIGNRDGFRLQYDGELVLSSKDSAEFIKGTQDFVAELYGVQLEAYRNLTPNSEELASVINAASVASEVFSAELWELADAYSEFSRRGENTVDFLSRVTNTAYSELQKLAQEIGVAGSAIGSLNALGVSIRESLLSDEELYGKLELQAETLASTIDGLTDPAAIANTVSEIQGITSRAFGLLDDQQRQTIGSDLADFIDEVTAAASLRTAEIAEQRQEEISNIDNLAASTQNMATAAESFQLAIDQMSSMISEMRSFITSSGGEVTSYNL